MKWLLPYPLFFIFYFIKQFLYIFSLIWAENYLNNYKSSSFSSREPRFDSQLLHDSSNFCSSSSRDLILSFSLWRHNMQATHRYTCSQSTHAHRKVIFKKFLFSYMCRVKHNYILSIFLIHFHHIPFDICPSHLQVFLKTH